MQIENKTGTNSENTEPPIRNAVVLHAENEGDYSENEYDGC